MGVRWDLNGIEMDVSSPGLWFNVNRLIWMEVRRNLHEVEVI